MMDRLELDNLTHNLSVSSVEDHDDVTATFPGLATTTTRRDEHRATSYDYCKQNKKQRIILNIIRMVVKLNPDAVRERAKSIPGCYGIPSDCSTVCSFLVACLKDDSQNKATIDVEKMARVNVFWDTGTVVTCRLLQGSVRQTFRRDVTSLDVVERLLRYPPSLTLIDDALVSFTDDTHERNAERPHKARLELAEVGHAILQNEKEKLVRHLRALEDPNDDDDVPPSPSDRSETTAEASQHTMTAGMEFQFSLPASSMKHVDQCLSDINSMGKYIRGVATNGKGTVFLYGNGGVAYTPHIPRPLYHKLSKLRSSPAHARPSYVSLGTRDRYFVSFQDGAHVFKGPKGLEKELKKLEKAPRSVAFGSTWETFFIVLADGSWTFQGRGIPAGLERKLLDREDSPDLSAVTLGPDGEAWFMKAENGRMWWGGVTDELDDNIQELLTHGCLNYLDFGEDDSYFVSYDE